MRLVVLLACCLAVFAAPTAAPEPCSKGYVALTFDDGPRSTTPALLAALEREQLRATLFVVGARAAARPELVRRSVRAGMWVENHSYTHARLTRLDDAEVVAELRATQRVLQRLTGRTPTLMRPPYLATNARVRKAAWRLGLTEVLATVDTHDSRGASADAITDAAERLRPGGVLLMHDRAPTIRAIPRIADVLAERGLCAGPVSST